VHPSNKITKENLKEVVYWHRPNAEAVAKMEPIADACHALMLCILENAPDCADRSSALRCVREARMWANASIAIDPASALPIDHERKA
jgi:D-hexose-6-phosphate mutarotase